MERLDPKIVPLVSELEQAGYFPYMSCQGGSGHSSDFRSDIREKCWISFIGDEVPEGDDISEVKGIIRKYSQAPVRTIRISPQDPDDIPDDQVFFVTRAL